MALDTRQRRVRPTALVGMIFIINSAVFIVVGVLLGAYVLATSTPLLALKLLAPIFLGVGLLELLAGLLLRLLPGDSPTANVVNQYYAAFANMDYMTAFQYLDPSMKTPQGQPITPDWFVQSAQACDAEQGSVTGYRLSGVQANPGIRRFTIKVTRERGSYKNNLFLQKQGADWKIIGFDRF